MGSETYHEPYEILTSETREMHRALVSLMEELEAVDWYQQRADGCQDPELRAVLVHNKNEEIEHAVMVLEWIRRRSEVFDKELRTYLFTDMPILEAEERATGEALDAEQDKNAEEAPAEIGDGSLRIGRLE